MKLRLDQALVSRGLVLSRSQAENFIKLGYVNVDRQPITKPGYLVDDRHKIVITAAEQYVSRAALKLASVVGSRLEVDFTDKVVLDVGSSTGGFTDYALRHGSRLVIAVDVGTNQLHPTLRDDPRIELREKTDIRSFVPTKAVDLILADVSFISLRDILPHLATLASPKTVVLVMAKPQFEAAESRLKHLKHKGVVKNDAIRRHILKEFEQWLNQAGWLALGKADSEVAGAKGNRERFYLLRKA